LTEHVTVGAEVVRSLAKRVTLLALMAESFFVAAPTGSIG
jgi:hypothetical protein